MLCNGKGRPPRRTRPFPGRCGAARGREAAPACRQRRGKPLKPKDREYAEAPRERRRAKGGANQGSPRLLTNAAVGSRQNSARVFEKLHCAFVLLGGFTCPECSKVLSRTGFWVRFSRVQPVFSAFQFPDHADESCKSNANQLILRLGA